jgi:DNA repair exonuclease SbcCD ATPase subunit
MNVPAISTFLLLTASSWGLAGNLDAGPADSAQKEQIASNDHLIEQLKSLSIEKKQALVETSKQTLSQLDDSIEKYQAHLEDNWQNLSEKAKIVTQATLRTLKDQQVKLKTWIDETTDKLTEPSTTIHDVF